MADDEIDSKKLKHQIIRELMLELEEEDRIQILNDVLDINVPDTKSRSHSFGA